MNPTCPHCQSQVLPGDKFCPACGRRIAASAATSQSHDVHPLPATATAPQPGSRSVSRQRTSWYRRKLFVVPLILLILAGAGAFGTLAYFNSRFNDVNTISTPPPELPGERLGGDEGVVIDTGPAQEAVRKSQQQDTTDNSGNDNGDDNPTGNVVSAMEKLERGDSAAATPEGDSGGQVANNQGNTAGNVLAAVDGPDETFQSQDVALKSSSDGSVNILLMGVDARPGEPIDIEVRPDTLAVLHLDGETGSCRILSVPRDTRTELPGYGLSKVNHALAVGGIPYQVLVTQNLLGIEIDHFGLIDFSGIEGLVDAVGGVTVVNEEAFSVGSTTFDQGTINLDGEQALDFARYRGGSDGDFGRIGRQQQIVRALISQTSGMDVVTGAYDLLRAVEGHVKTDLSPTDLISLANDYRSTCTEQTVEMKNLTGTVGMFPDPLLKMDLSFVTVDPAEIRQKVEWLTGTP